MQLCHPRRTPVSGSIAARHQILWRHPIGDLRQHDRSQQRRRDLRSPTDSNNNTVRNNTSFSNTRGYVRAAAGIDVRNEHRQPGVPTSPTTTRTPASTPWTWRDSAALLPRQPDVRERRSRHRRAQRRGRADHREHCTARRLGIEMTTQSRQRPREQRQRGQRDQQRSHRRRHRVDSASVPTTTVNDDLVFLRVPGEMIDWNGVKYSSLAAFRVATGQESRGIQAIRLRLGSAATSISSPAPLRSTPPTAAHPPAASDFDGAVRFDDPATANTGIGAVAYADRGAFEYDPELCDAGGAAIRIPGTRSGRRRTGILVTSERPAQCHARMRRDVCAGQALEMRS